MIKGGPLILTIGWGPVLTIGWGPVLMIGVGCGSNDWGGVGSPTDVPTNSCNRPSSHVVVIDARWGSMGNN